jgi:hypothetical protein
MKAMQATAVAVTEGHSREDCDGATARGCWAHTRISANITRSRGMIASVTIKRIEFGVVDRGLGFSQAVPSRVSATARPMKGSAEWSRREGLAVHGETRMINRAGKQVASSRRYLSDWQCRRTRTAEDCSAPSFAKASPATHDAAVAIFDNRSRDREAFLPLGISPSR